MGKLQEKVMNNSLWKQWIVIDWQKVKKGSVTTLPEPNVFVWLVYKDKDVYKVTKGYWNRNLLDNPCFTIDCLDSPGLSRYADTEIVAWMPFSPVQASAKHL